MAKREISQTAKEYGRGIAGGLLFSLPLLYTMEVWWTGFIASPQKLLGFIVFTFLLLIGYNKYSGMRADASIKDILHESVEEIALAFLVAFLFLMLINKVNFSMSFDEIAGKVIVESMIGAIGVSVGTSQLGQIKNRKNQEKKPEEDDEQQKSSKDKINISEFNKMLILSVCGGVLVSSSVAPTEEILRIAIVSTPLHLLAMIGTSLLVSAVVLFFSDFKGAGPIEGGVKKIIFHLTISYLSALIVSVVMLWFFGRIAGGGLDMIIAQSIVLAIPASLGASAGRLLISLR